MNITIKTLTSLLAISALCNATANEPDTLDERIMNTLNEDGEQSLEIYPHSEQCRRVVDRTQYMQWLVCDAGDMLAVSPLEITRHE